MHNKQFIQKENANIKSAKKRDQGYIKKATQNLIHKYTISSLMTGSIPVYEEIFAGTYKHTQSYTLILRRNVVLRPDTKTGDVTRPVAAISQQLQAYTGQGSEKQIQPKRACSLKRGAVHVSD